MIIKADKEGKQIINQLCDIALKSLGMAGREGINRILASIEDLPEKLPKGKADGGNDDAERQS